jgi:transposase
MPAPYSNDLRERVRAKVESGWSRRETAELFDIGASSAIKWMQRVEETGNCAAKPMGGSVSPLDEHKEVILALIVETADMTLDELVVAVHKRKLGGSRTALWRFLKRHEVTLKKNAVRGRTRTA